MRISQLKTRHGTITFPTFMPVTTFGGKFPLDDLIRPYLNRFAQCVMVSYHYAKQMKSRPNLPLFVDSGGFASLFEGSEILAHEHYASIKTKGGDIVSPHDVLALQEKYADIGATLDFIIPPGLSAKDSIKRQNLTIKNAIWAIENRTKDSLQLFASIQAWDKNSAYRIMKKIAGYPFDGFALGGMVPRVMDPKFIISIVRAIRDIEPNRPLHVFGIGQPTLIKELFNLGVSSTDSSSFLRATADKKMLDPSSSKWISLNQNLAALPDCDCASCKMNNENFFRLPGEANNIGLALHNLNTTVAIVQNFNPLVPACPLT